MNKEESPFKGIESTNGLQEKVRRKMMSGILQSTDISDTQNLAKALLDFEQACAHYRGELP